MNGRNFSVSEISALEFHSIESVKEVQKDINTINAEKILRN